MQYQFIIDEYQQILQSTESSETLATIVSCRALHTHYLREAYIKHLEVELAETLQSAPQPAGFLQFAAFSTAEDYCSVLESQVWFGARECSIDGFPITVFGVAPKQLAICHSRKHDFFSSAVH